MQSGEIKKKKKKRKKEKKERKKERKKRNEMMIIQEKGLNKEDPHWQEGTLLEGRPTESRQKVHILPNVSVCLH